jgi:hypothetical protein
MLNMNGRIIWVAQAEQQPSILGVIDLKNIEGQILTIYMFFLKVGEE